MFKVSYRLILVTLLITTLVFISACGRKGKVELDMAPTIEITSYTGIDSTDIDEEWENNPTIFQQDIWWSASDPDGTVEGYAFKVEVWDENLRGYTPISTPGYEYIDNDGWVYHYQPGANEDIPMDDPDAHLTIWSQLLHAKINFPADGEPLLDDNGDPVYQEILDGADSVLVYQPVQSRFLVKCIDNSGLESDTAIKFFNSSSSAPKVIISSSQGEIDGETVGTGLLIEFTILDFDPLVSAQADYFEFMLMKMDEAGNEIYEDGYGEWYTTVGEDDKGYAVLTNTGYTTPRIYPNSFVGDEPQDHTYLVARAFDIAGIPSRTDTISFAVKEGFYPGTFIYNGAEQSGNDVWVLGQNHFVTYSDPSINKLIPSVATPEGNRFSTPFWIDKDDQYTAINSSDLNIYMHWGWKGEYKNNDPNDRKNNDVLDENTNTSYFSEIIYFDLRLDGEAFVYPPLPPDMFNITDSTGTWLRVPVNFDIGQTAILYGLGSGEHVFEVRAVDLQLLPDPTPATFTFYLYEPIPLDSKSGILIIDDDPHNNNNCPDDSTDALYEYFVSDYPGEVVQFDRVQWPNTNSVYHFGRSKFAPTDFIPYELIIYHSDDPTVSTNIVSEYDPLYLYLRSGGNMILSGGARLKDAQEQMIEGFYMLFDRYFGLPLPVGNDQESAGQITQVSWNGTNGAFQTLQFFQFARAEAAGYTDIHLQIPSFNILLNLQGQQGLGPVCYFDNLTPGTEIYYSFGCRPEIEEEEDTDHLPNQAQYDFFNGKPVGIKYSTAITNCYTFGFPLAYMDKDEVKVNINRILIELGMM